MAFVKTLTHLMQSRLDDFTAFI